MAEDLEVSCSIDAYRTASFPTFAQPIEVGWYSVDDAQKVHFDKRQLKKMLVAPLNKPLEVNLNLNIGYGNQVKKDMDDKLGKLLIWVLHTLHSAGIEKKNVSDGKVTLKAALYNADFVCYRGMLTRIATTLFSPREGWIACVSKFQDVYFLCEFFTDKKKQYDEGMTDRDKMMAYWGHSFERHLVSPVDGDSSEQSLDWAINLNEEFCSVVRSKLSDHRLIFGGETDCIDPNTLEYVELKTSRLIETDKQLESFRKFKTVKWWAQSFLIGINTIICGFRNDDGYVKALQRFSLSDLSQQGKPYWSGATCFNFLADFLSLVKEKVPNNNANVVYKFEYDPIRRRIDFEVDDSLDHVFLPDWFVQDVLRA